MRLDVPRRILRVVRRYFKKPNEVQFEGCVLYFFGQDHGPLALGRSSHVVCGEPSYTKTDLQIDTKVYANDWSIGASRACHDLVVAVEEVSQRTKAMMDREQSIRHVFELWRIRNREGGGGGKERESTAA